MAGIATALARMQSRCAYCHELGQWMEREVALLPRNSLPDFMEAIKRGSLAFFVAGTRAPKNPDKAARLILEFVAHARESVSSFPVYATVEGVCTSGLWAVLTSGRGRYTVLRQTALEPVEVLDLRPLFPQLSRLLEQSHPEARTLLDSVMALPGLDEVPGDRAEIVPVPGDSQRRVGGPGYLLAVNLRGAIPVMCLLRGGVGAFFGLVCVFSGDATVLGWFAVMAGLASLVWGWYTNSCCHLAHECRWVNRRLREEIRLRADAWVDADDPESIYLDIVPRRRFAGIGARRTSDIVLLKVDESQKTVLMEGDCRRYRMPVDSIWRCEAQCLYLASDSEHRFQIWTVRLLIRVEEGLHELLCVVGNVSWKPMTNARRRQIAEQLCARINRLRPQETGTAVATNERLETFADRNGCGAYDGLSLPE